MTTLTAKQSAFVRDGAWCASEDVAKLEAERDALSEQWKQLVTANAACANVIHELTMENAQLREELRPKSAAEEHNAMLTRTGQLHPVTGADIRKDIPAPPGQGHTNG